MVMVPMVPRQNIYLCDQDSIDETSRFPSLILWIQLYYQNFLNISGHQDEYEAYYHFYSSKHNLNATKCSCSRGNAVKAALTPLSDPSLHCLCL